MKAETVSPNLIDASTEQRIRLEGVSWPQYESLLSTLSDDFPALRMSYLNGTLEIMTNSPLHEKLKKVIAMLLEAYFQETRTRFSAMGSATFREVAKQRGLEPDECYCLEKEKEVPDLAIEVVLSSGLVDKLAIYQGLGVTEIWVWENNTFTLYHLCSDEQGSRYEKVTNSELLPDCDIQLLSRYVQPQEQFDAVMSYRDELRSQA